MKDDRHNLTDYSDIILDRIGECLEDMDYSALGDSIRESVEFIRKEAEEGYKAYRVKASKEKERFSQNMGTPYQRYAANQRKQGPNQPRPLQRMQQTKQPVPVRSNVPLRTVMNLPGKISGPVEAVFGAISCAVFGTVSLMGLSITIPALLGIGGVATGTLIGGLTILSGTTILTGLSGFLLGHGIFARKRADRIEQYNQFLSGKDYVMIEDLVKFSKQSEKTVRKDLKFIMEQKLAPNMTMDEKETCLLLTNRARQQYITAEKSRIQREIEEIRQKEEAEALERKKAMASKEEREFLEFEEAIDQFLQELNQIRTEINSQRMLDHANQVENLLQQIYLCVKEHPDMIYATGHLVDYYLPCMNKLFHTYEDLEDQPIQGDNILKTKKEIENSFDTIESALTNMYDELFQEVSMDISSDIQVLKTVMAQDGLNDTNGFK